MDESYSKFEDALQNGTPLIKRGIAKSMSLKIAAIRNSVNEKSPTTKILVNKFIENNMYTWDRKLGEFILVTNDTTIKQINDLYQDFVEIN